MASKALLISSAVVSVAIIINGVLYFYGNKPAEINVAPAKTAVYLLPGPERKIYVQSPPVTEFGPVIPPQNVPAKPIALHPASPTIVSVRKTTWGPDRIVLAGFDMNGKGNEIVVKPSEKIKAASAYVYDCPTCQMGSINQIIVGLAGIGAQACIYNGSTESGGVAAFTLTAPQKPGIYDVRARYAQDYGCRDALAKWWNMDGAPDKGATMGRIIVE